MAGRWFSPGAPFSSTNKTDCHNITEILLKVALKTINQTSQLHCACLLSSVLMTGIKETSMILADLTKIIWLTNLLTLSVADEAYYRNVWGTLNSISTFLLRCSHVDGKSI
jgi:hypothetical protein